MDSTADHQFNPKSASPALKQAMEDLARELSHPVSELVDIRLGDAYDLAVQAYGESSLPDFWKVWNSWNVASDTPAPWGDL